MKRLCCLLAGVLATATSTSLAAADSAFRFTWDQQAVRAAAAANVPTSLWNDDPARERLQLMAEAVAAADPTFPDLAKAWDSWRLFQIAGAADGSAAWMITGIGDAAWVTKRFGSTAVIAEGRASATVPGAPAIAEASGAPISCELDAGALVKGSQALAPILDQLLAGWRAGRGHLAVRVQPAAGAWTGSTVLTGMTTTLQPIDPALVARLGPASLRFAVHAPPAQITAAISFFAGSHQSFVEDLVGRPVAEATALLSGDIACSIAPGLPIPHVLVVVGTKPGADLAPVLGNLGDAFRARPAQLAGATRAWSWDSPAGPLHAGIGPGVIVVGTDASEVALALAGSSDGWRIPAQACLHLEADPALLSALLPMAMTFTGPVRIGEDPLIALLRSLVPAAEGLVGVGATSWEALYVSPEGLSWGQPEARRTCRPAPDSEAEIVRVIGGTGTSSDRLRSSVAIWTAANRPPLLVARRADGFYAIQGGDSGGPLSEVRLQAVVKGMQRIIGPDFAELLVVASPSRPVIDARMLPSPRAYAAASGLWTATLIQSQDRAELTENGAPVLSLLAAWGAVRWWQSAQVQATTDL